MPRIINRQTPTQRIARAKRQRAPANRQWVDPFPDVHGTLPEKMVYAALSKFGIAFYFLNDQRYQIPEIELDKEYQHDFIIPQSKVIIEVQGAYWHSKPKTVESDAYKFAVAEISGYKILGWWDYDIIARVDDMVLSEPALMAARGAGLGYVGSRELAPRKRTKVDTSKGIRTLNARRSHGKQAKVGRRKIRKGMHSYAGNSARA